MNNENFVHLTVYGLEIITSAENKKFCDLYIEIKKKHTMEVICCPKAHAYLSKSLHGIHLEQERN